MNVKSIYLGLFFFSLIILQSSSCDDDTPPRGCTCDNALNYDILAEENDGTCIFSNVCFYAKYDSYSYYNSNWGIWVSSAVSRVDVEVFNAAVGIIGSVSQAYPNGPGNCDAPGTITYRIRPLFGEDKDCSWDFVRFESHIYLVDGTYIYQESRLVSADHDKECIMVNVTN
ncbi:MAG: hypothetical protein K9H16_04510 [Bacteroidales bacterium]|nr:hypothetical protein [Bacteroidales bacterium]